MNSMATLLLVILATLLVACATKSEDVFSRVPSSFHGGTKWVLFRKPSSSQPSSEIGHADNNAQVSSTDRFQQPYQLQDFSPVTSLAPPVYVSSTTVQEPQVPVLVTPKPHQSQQGPVLGDEDTIVIESRPGPPQQYPGHNHQHFGQGTYPSKYQSDYQNFEIEKPRVKVTSFTSVPIAAVHFNVPAFVEYFRKK